MKSPSYLYRRKYGFSVRIRVSQDLAPWFSGRDEIRVSVKTTNPKKAAERARLTVGYIQWIFRDIRAGGRMAELTDAEMDKLIKDYVAELLKDNVNLWLKQKPLTDDADVEQRAFFFKSLSIDAHDQMVRRDFEGRYNGSDGSVNACQNVDAMLAGAGLQIAPGSLEYSKLCLRMLKGLADLYQELEHKTMNGILEDEDEGEDDGEEGAAKATAGGIRVIGGNGTVTFGQAAQSYWDERSGDWKPRTRSSYQSAFDHLLEHFGADTPVAEIDYYGMKEYRDKLRGEKKLSVSRTNFYLGFVKAVFNLEMKTTRQLTVNPASGLTLRDDRRRQDLREVFNDDELKKLFVKSLEYGRDRHNLPYKFWIPLLGLYTGAREEELCQMDTTDIVEVDGVWCIDINQNGPQKSVKTSEQRIVPLHPFLVELGLPKFASGSGSYGWLMSSTSSNGSLTCWLIQKLANSMN